MNSILPELMKRDTTMPVGTLARTQRILGHPIAERGGGQGNMTKSSADERRSVRSKVRLTATVESRHGQVEVRVDDLSAHGARVFCEGLPPVDTPVTFRCKALTAESFVAWVEGPYAGIGFGEPVQPRDALRTVPRPQQNAPQDFRRPGFRGQRLTDAERQRVEDWGKPERKHPGE